MVGGWHLAQLNLAKALAPLDDPRLADFMAALDRVNALAEASPGFVWRLQAEDGNATSIRAYDDPRMIVNMSVWETAEALFEFTYRTAHAKVMGRRREWFEKLETPHLVLWWVPAGHRPGLAEAMARLAQLERDGPTPSAFTFKTCFSVPEVARAAAAMAQG
ncbi:MAG: DUF3291 domain-containing protein [Pseudomonadota bacterium]